MNIYQASVNFLIFSFVKIGKYFNIFIPPKMYYDYNIGSFQQNVSKNQKYFSHSTNYIIYGEERRNLRLWS